MVPNWNRRKAEIRSKEAGIDLDATIYSPNESKRGRFKFMKSLFAIRPEMRVTYHENGKFGSK